jgi:Predicted rRNA methylase (SpoU class)
MQIVLFEPEIPPNTGNVARLCAATGIVLNLIKPLGFSLADRYLKRAGLDYWEHVKMQVWESFADFLFAQGKTGRLVATSARQGIPVHEFKFEENDILVFGPETRGLPPEVLNEAEQRIRIPVKDAVRSLNLSTATGIVLYQALFSSGKIKEIH